MLGIDHQRGRRRETELGADPRLSGGQRGGAVPVPGLGRVVRMEEPDIAPEGLPLSGSQTGTAYYPLQRIE